MKQNLRFGPILGRPAVLIISAILLKHPTFEGGFLFFMENTNIKIEFLYIVLPVIKS